MLVNKRRLAAMLAVAFASTSALADLYWQGANSALFDDTANWSTSSSGSSAGVYPTTETGITYWRNYKNGSTVFNSAATVGGNVILGLADGKDFVWSVTDHSYGLTADGKEFQLGYNSKTPDYLRIDGGTYKFGTMRLGYTSNSTVGLTLTNDVDLTCNAVRIVSGKSGVNSTLAIKGGMLTATNTAEEALSICNNDNTIGTLVVDGGTLNTTNGYASMGYCATSTSTVHIVSGAWNVKGIRVGGKSASARAVANAVARFVVDGGTFSVAAESGVGYATGEGSSAEMVINGGTVNYGHTSFYVGDYGPGTFTMNGGTFTMPSSDYGVTICHDKGGPDVGMVILNGGVLTTGRLRTQYAQPGSKITFNGGTIKATKSTAEYLNENANIICEVAEGGLVFDTAGFDVTIAHDIVAANGAASTPLIKKGDGKLTFTGATPFTAANTTVLGGSVSIVPSVVDGSSGGYLGTIVMHGPELDGWLKDADIYTYTSRYGAKGTAALERPNTVKVKVNGQVKSYENLEIGITTNDTFNGVSYSFTTENVAPRTLSVFSTVNNKAIKNVRDCGSWPLVSVAGTKKMNQGVIFRGGHLDYFVNATAAQKAASALAGLKTEIDLRHVDSDNDIAAEYQTSTYAVEKSWAAVDGDYFPCPLDYNKGCTQIDTSDASFTNQVRRMFSKLGTPGALPAYFHCRIGTDRTGITGLLLLGMMGVDDECLYRDYLMSNFASIGGSRSPDVPEKFLRYILRGNCNSKKYVYTSKDAQYGVSVASRCRQYLEMCGVTTEEIGNITMALSGETPDQVLARVNAYESAKGVRTVSYVPYPGSTDTNATHRLPAGEYLLPYSTPSRDEYIFLGWDTENEANGIVYGAWKKPDYRYWASGNGAAESFTRAASWDPAPDGDFGGDDILVINRGVDKVAEFSEGSVSVNKLYVGWGSYDGGNSYISADSTSDRCGRLDVTDGTLNVTNYFYVGGYRTTKNISNTVNVSGGRVVAGRLYVGDYTSKGDRCDAFSISGTGVVEVTVGEIRFASEYDSGGAVASLHISDDGVLRGVKDAKFGYYGKAAAVLEDNATLDVSGRDIYLGNGSGTCGEISLTNSASLLFNDMWVGYSASSTGRVVVAGNNNATNITASHYIYLGRKGSGELTIDSGEVSVSSVVQFGYDGASGNDTVLNLNGGKLKARQLKVLGTPNAVFNWNGGTLECADYDWSDGDMIPDSALAVNVLEGGAIYNAVVFNNEEIKHSLSGVGTLTKTGSKPLTVSGAVDLDGGFVVEEGALTLSNVTGTEFALLSVADGATLDLNGAEVTVDEYVLGGEKQRGGRTYSAHNGTIHVNSSGESFGGYVIDTAGSNRTISDDIVLPEGTAPQLIKKGGGRLTLSGNTPFTAENIFVCEGSVKFNGKTYNVNVGTNFVTTAGGDLGVVDIHGEALEGWLKNPDFTTYSSVYGAAGTATLEQPLGVVVDVGSKLKGYINLETGKTYSDTLDGVSYSFTVEDHAPRTLKMISPVTGSAIINIRDIGSWPIVSVDGTAKMNQGVIFRGGKLDSFVNSTEEQRAASVLANLKTEIDLRKLSEIDPGYTNVTKSWVAVDANYYHFSYVDATQLDATDSGNFTNQVRNVFSTLGTPGALPAYFHCVIGTDRTGLTGRLLLGLMGVDEEVMYRDYLMSNFANIGSSRSPDVTEKTLRHLLRGNCNSKKYVYNTKDAQYGVSVASRCRQYLEMCGVTTEEIGNITMALSGETPDEVLARVNAYETANNVRTVSYVPYPGSSDTNAMHRLPAGKHIFPTSSPSRTGYIFEGWDTENEANGIVYAAWKKQEVRYWADSNGAAESFTRAASWDPAPDGAFAQDEILALNKGVDKIAQFSEGSVTVDTLYLGWGSLNGGASASTSNDHGGRLDMTGGTLNVTNYLYLGGYRAAKNISNVVNISGGNLVVGRLRVGAYGAENGKCDTLNISGTGRVEDKFGEVQFAAYSSGGAAAALNMSDSGVLVSSQDVKFGTYGRGTAVLEDNATLDVSGKDIYLGNGSGTYGEISLADSATMSFYYMRVGYDASSTGVVTVAGNNNATNITAGHYIYLGRKGVGELTIDSGVVSVSSAVQFGYDGVSTTVGTLNLNGGKLITRQMKISGTPNAVFNWNGGVLEYSAASGDSTVDILPANSLVVNVLEGGAVYNAVVRSNEIINHSLSGVGALTKKGGKKLTISGEVALDGGFIVEEGTLVLSNVTDTEFTKLSVADGATLNLSGAEVTVDEYVLNGARQRKGTYSAHNGTIHVKSSGGGMAVIL